MLNLFYSHDRAIESAYIITLIGNSTSESMSQRCQSSCSSVGMPYKVWAAYDGTGEDSIVEPSQCQTDTFMRMLKISEHYMTKSEISCVLSHVSLWSHCVQIDKPIVILEHDAVLTRAVTHHNGYNNIIYLGSSEQHNQVWPMETKIPPFGSEGPNHYYLYGAHAYSIDPQVAKNLLAYVLRMGITTILDRIMRSDLFNISFDQFYGFELADKEKSTVVGKTDTKNVFSARTNLRNDRLEW